ncbi:unnamed protein product [Adineta steineri]|uniref:Choline transporter-like protein n=1 Tax=Adineta steineri TaxID=433720 RepID=A0A815F7A4_9BILA|nr:unnamed protein product [Adineta steineri]
MQRQYILIGLFTIIFLVIPSCGNALPDNGRVLSDEEYDDTDKSTTPIILSANDDNTTTTVSTTTTTTTPLTTTTSNVTADTTPTTTTTLETTTTASTITTPTTTLETSTTASTITSPTTTTTTTTTIPTTTTTSTTTTQSPTTAAPPGRKFDALSFIGGMILVIGLGGLIYLVARYLSRSNRLPYLTLSNSHAHRQYAVETSVQRALTTNFGTISFGSLILAFIKALRVVAQVNERNARQNGNIVLLLFSCIFVCILRIFEGFVRYLNEWAFVYAALTGQSFRAASRSFLDLFQQRGWTMIINDDLAGHALTIVTLAIGFISAALGGITVYAAMPHSQSRVAIAGMAAFFTFKIGLAMGTVMTSILSSGVRTAFVCFAINPAALGATHPEHLQNLLLAWYKFHPQEFAASGFAMHLPKPAASASVIYTNV